MNFDGFSFLKIDIGSTLALAPVSILYVIDVPSVSRSMSQSWCLVAVGSEIWSISAGVSTSIALTSGEDCVGSVVGSSTSIEPMKNSLSASLSSESDVKAGGCDDATVWTGFRGGLR